ncbi:Zn-dependent peptidase ImmA, M78 family [Lentzea albidocapillata subsp. violacea]|uniref:Zn-dependent peptidase ImmA, M78 family n=1 Tax=Lentzea albidocapillata subsp. violacea TaxID=128104 RepID=A0A1G9X5E6_9PSEU|nr:Zn-dependent peptidase ImmA, M78 family [Lentzea albidocapillata subsp. violacea]
MTAHLVAGDGNPELLVAAREALGWTQRQLAEELTRLSKADPEISQGYVSRVEKGSLSVSADRLELFSAVLEVTPDFLAGEGKLWSLGDGCVYHRNRKSTKASTLRTLHAQVNLLRLFLRRLAAGSTVTLREFNLVPMQVGGLDGPEDVARALRRELELPEGPIESVTEVAERVGALVVPMSLGGREVDATSLHPPGEAPVFVINTDAPADRQRFTQAHELGHIACAPALDLGAEEMAQAFASEFLAPAAQVRPDLQAAPITPARLLQLKARWRISAAALLRRALDLGVVTDSRYRTLNTQMSALGWKTAEPEPLPPEVATAVPTLLRAAVDAAGGVEAAAALAGTTAAKLRAMLGDQLLGVLDD